MMTFETCQMQHNNRAYTYYFPQELSRILNDFKYSECEINTIRSFGSAIKKLCHYGGVDATVKLGYRAGEVRVLILGNTASSREILTGYGFPQLRENE